MHRAKNVLAAIFVRPCDRWEWLLTLALLVGAIATSVAAIWVALLGIVLGRQSERAVRAWKARRLNAAAGSPRFYCVRERKAVEATATQGVQKNGRPFLRAVCPDCGTRMFKIGTLEDAQVERA